MFPLSSPKLPASQSQTMRTLQTGVDLIEIKRVEKTIAQYGQKFLDRIFTPKEQALCDGNVEMLAVRFAAKEAVSKALLTGIGPIQFTDIEILHGERGQPVLTLIGPARKIAAVMNLNTWSLSLSHTHNYAVAFVVALG